ncbi:SUMF1/EgtB/PvdO family nonheme iron enzyme [bacterium]|nr:SUMF1/EgtB/PvdO family nonheme iron enzyme [bacterium]
MKILFVLPILIFFISCVRPQQKYFINRFKMDATEVTVEDFRECVNAGVCKKEHFSYYSETSKISKNCNYERNGFDNHPMNCVNYYGANQFCTWLGKRLPLRIEWEYAAKGGENYKYAGSDNIKEVAWFGKNQTNSVASLKPNGYGLYDMTGNVWEWTTFTIKCAISKQCVVKGGSFKYFSQEVNIESTTIYMDLAQKSDSVGFRCMKME